MELSEKIYTCRKRSGMSQEELSEKLGVSRQAVSKWETGHAEPETGKLRLLSETFGVTVDWLLSGGKEPDTPAMKSGDNKNNWVDSVPGAIGKLLRRYGWIFGIYTGVSGILFFLMGMFIRFISGAMFSGVQDYQASRFDGPASGLNLLSFNPVSFMGSITAGIGILLMLAGIILSVLLKKYSKKEK